MEQTKEVRAYLSYQSKLFVLRIVKEFNSVNKTLYQDQGLAIYKEQNQANAIDFVGYVVAKFPFRIKSIRTDRGHEFQVKFHWHVEDLGMEHHYFKARTPQLNGKVERSHLTDQRKFYQLLTYKDDVDLKQKLSQWESFYNFERPHGAHQGKTPYEVLKTKLTF